MNNEYQQTWMLPKLTSSFSDGILRGMAFKFAREYKKTPIYVCYYICKYT